MRNIRATLGIACALQLSLLGCSSSDGDSEQTERASAEDTDAGHRKADSGSAVKHVDAGDTAEPPSDNRPAAAMGSGDGDKPSPARSSADDGLITYERDIRPLLENNCIECHSEGGIGPGQFDDWDSVQKLSAEIVNAVTGGIMPPWPASDDCHPIQDARSLPDATKALFAQWQMDGFLQGDGADYVAPDKKRRLDLGTPDLMFQGNEPYTPAVNGDSYRCFFAGAVSEDTYITALDIIPTDRAEVHHVI
ncbi:MAG TPA: cytochrome c, partial [Polyangiaceae bacterium]|nr:cytochrome c [Polyangiaceae bacterium]